MHLRFDTVRDEPPSAVRSSEARPSDAPALALIAAIAPLVRLPHRYARAASSRTRSRPATSMPTSVPRVRWWKAQSLAASCMKTHISTPAGLATILATYMPFPVTKEVLERGRERYNIYCAPCHSRVGDGNGFIPSRGFTRMPPSYHIPRLQKAPLGYFFDVMTNGFGIMPDYASQVSPRRSLEDCGLHSRPAIEPERDHEGRTSGTEGPVAAAEICRTRFGRNATGDHPGK